MPDASGLNVAWSQASIATPAKPMTRPRIREWVGRSFSQSHATTAPNSGTVAFRIADRPVVIASSAKAKQAKGIAELSRPTTKIGRQLRRNTGVNPRSQSMGNKLVAAIATRRPAVGTGPNSTVAMRVNRKDEPQIAASNTKSTTQLRAGAAAAPTGTCTLILLLTSRLPAAAMRSCVPGRPHNR